MKKQLTLLEIDNDGPIREWAASLMSERHQEAIDSLEFEGVSQETVFYLELGSKRYIAFYSEGDSISPSDKTKKINQDHRAVLDKIVIWEDGRPKRAAGELLYDVRKK